MTTAIWKSGTSNAVTTTLDGSITDTDATIALTSTTGLQFPGIVIVDRLDANDEPTPLIREYISFTGISGNSLTGCDRSGLGGSTAQAHNSGANVEEVWSVDHWNDFLDVFDAEHDTDGTHDDTIMALLAGAQTFTGVKTFASPVINTGVSGTAILDEDAMGSDSATKVPTQQSVKAYVDSGTVTMTNKRVTKRVTTITSHATPTVNSDNCDVVTITAQAEAITSMTTNLSGTPTNFQALIFRILDDGTGRAITWGAKFEARGVDLPTTTTASKLLTVGFIYDTVDSIWGCIASADES